MGRSLRGGKSGRAAATAVTALLAAAIAAAAAQATFPGQDGRISFTRFLQKSNSAEIFTANPDGSDLRQITSVPKGRSAVFSDWSPDGQKIAYDTDAPDVDGLEDVVQVYIANTDGTGVVQLTRGPGFHADATWSPDMTRLAIEADWGDYPALEGIWIIPASDPDGVTVGDAVRLTTLPEGFGFDSEPQWSPDGSAVVFTRFKSAKRSAIFRVNADGTGLTQLTPYSLNASYPDWSPDGQTIIFDSNDFGGNVGKAGNIYSMPAAGGEMTRLTDYKKIKRRANFRLAQNPVYSPSGTRIMFTIFRRGGTKVIVMAADGADRVRVPLGKKTELDNRLDWGPLPTP